MRSSPGGRGSEKGGKARGGEGGGGDKRGGGGDGSGGDGGGGYGHWLIDEGWMTTRGLLSIGGMQLVLPRGDILLYGKKRVLLSIRNSD